MASYYVEGEIKEIKFEKRAVLFSIEPSQDFRRKEGNREYVLKLLNDDEEKPAVLVPLKEFEKMFLKCETCALCFQITNLKMNRSKVRVCFCNDGDAKEVSVEYVIVK